MARQPHHSANWGGARPNSGRGHSPDKYSKELVRRAHEEGQHPFDYLLAVMRDPDEDKRNRMYAANACMPYCAQKLTQTEIMVVNELDNLSLAEKIALAASMRNNILEQRPDMTLPQLPVIEGEVVSVNN